MIKDSVISDHNDFVKGDNKLGIFIRDLAKREKISEIVVKKMISDSIKESYCRENDSSAVLHFDFEEKLSVYRVYNIVEEVKDYSVEISSNSSKLKEGKIIDSIFYLPIKIEDFSFDTNSNIKKKLSDKVKNKRRKDQGGIQSSRLIRGRIKGYDSNNYLLDIFGGKTGFWDKEEWDKRKEEPRFNQSFFFVVDRIEKGQNNDDKIYLTRQSDAFIRKIMELQIPEISDGSVSICHIIRVPKLVNKVIVRSNVEGLDPLGACIGEYSERIREITKLVFPERIDIVLWTENEKELLLNLLPVKVISVIDEKEKVRIIISKDKLPLVLQLGGKLVKNISQYLNKEILIDTFEDFHENSNSSLFVWNGNFNRFNINKSKPSKNKLW